MVCCSGFSVVGYLPEWRYGSFNFETACKTYTHILFFSLEPGPNGELLGMDRFPSNLVLLDAKAAARKSGTKLLVCFGGNGRSAHFGSMSGSEKSRATFAQNVASLVASKGLDGVDINWEYPGFAFGRGYIEESVDREWNSLALLMKDLRKSLPSHQLTLAYYPDGKQEGLLHSLKVSDQVDLFHAMSYDASGPQHSPYELALQVVQNARNAKLDLKKITIGLPFYGRRRSGDWVTYEDIVQRHAPLPYQLNSVEDIGFNGKDMIAKKTQFALENCGGVMIWEAGEQGNGEKKRRVGIQFDSFLCRSRLQVGSCQPKWSIS